MRRWLAEFSIDEDDAVAAELTPFAETPGGGPSGARSAERAAAAQRPATTANAPASERLATMANAPGPPPHPHPPVGVVVIGVGAMGAHHAESLAQRVTGARLLGVADPQPGLAEQLAASLGCDRWTRDYQQLLADPAVEAVVIATPARFHAEIVTAAAQAGKAVFCEKPIAHTLADADLALAATRQASVPFQIGFQRRFDRAFAAARTLVDSGQLGRVQVLRSLTRDPSFDQPERVSPGALFLETLIHDFDVLRFLAGGAEPVEVHALADALVRPEWKSRGMLDTAVVSLRYDTGALATADATFQAVYGYDVRAEVLGSEGMASVGESSPINLVHHSRVGSTRQRPHWFVDLFGQAYSTELAHFVAHVRGLAAPDATGADGRAALVLALAALRSVETGRPVRTDEMTP
jgi:myo-inositol 2-dehydrogenase / D-chiro-inositol 1-dehydrogenase